MAVMDIVLTIFTFLALVGAGFLIVKFKVVSVLEWMAEKYLEWLLGQSMSEHLKPRLMQWILSVFDGRQQRRQRMDNVQHVV